MSAIEIHGAIATRIPMPWTLCGMDPERDKLARREIKSADIPAPIQRRKHRNRGAVVDKECKRCGIGPNRYYSNSRMADGYINYCCACVFERKREQYEANPDYREQESARKREEYRRRKLAKEAANAER